MTTTDVIPSAKPASARQLELMLRDWHVDVAKMAAFQYRGQSLLALIDMDVQLLLRERWLRRSETRWRSQFARLARQCLCHMAPGVLFELERRRVPSGAGLEGAAGRVVVLVQGATESDAGTLIPLIRRLERGSPAPALVATCEALGSRRLIAERIPFTSVFDAGSQTGTYTAMARLAMTTFQKAARTVPGTRGDLLRVIQRLGVFEALSYRLMHVMQVIDASVALIDQSPAAVVVASDVHPAGKTLVRLANAKGIPTIVVQNGMYGETTAAVTIGFLPISARTVCVWGEGAAQVLAQHGIPRDRIRITGQPRFDRLYAIPLSAAEAIRERLGLTSQTTLITFASQNIFSRRERYDVLKRAFDDVVRAMPGTVFVIKVHPSEDAIFWRNVVGDNQHMRVEQQIDLHGLIAASDVVVTAFSTVGLEALLMNKPLVIIQDLERSSEMRYVEFGAALAADSTNLAEVIRRAHWDAKTRQALTRGREAFVGYYANAADGRSVDRVIAVIAEMIELSATVKAS